MGDPLRTIHVEPGSELDRLLDDATRGAVVLIRDGMQFLVERIASDDVWEGYEAEAVRRTIDEMAGSWAAEDTDKMIADIYRWREEGSRPPDRP